MGSGSRLAFVLLDSFFPPAHGGAHMIRSVAEGFAAQGHEILVILLFEGRDNAADAIVGTAQTVDKLRELGIRAAGSPAGTIRFEHRSVHYAGVDRTTDRFLPFVLSELTRFGADAVVLNDIGGSAAHTVLKTVHAHFDGLIIYNPMTVHMLPGGPLALFIDRAAGAVLPKTRVVAPSAFCARYIAEHFRTAARFTIPPMFASWPDRPPDPRERFGQPFGVFNPNTWKGLPMILGLADRRPEIPFLVRCSWRTAEADLSALRARPNIRLQMQAVGSGGSIYDAASTILVPSLCHESLGLIPIESMLHGLPVIAARHGGLEEAGLGAALARDVAPIVFHPEPDGPGSRAREEVPEQPFAGWLEAIDRLWTDPEFHAQAALRGWRRANEFVASLSWEATEAAFLG